VERDNFDGQSATFSVAARKQLLAHDVAEKPRHRLRTAVCSPGENEAIRRSIVPPRCWRAGWKERDVGLGRFEDRGGLFRGPDVADQDDFWRLTQGGFQGQREAGVSL